LKPGAGNDRKPCVQTISLSLICLVLIFCCGINGRELSRSSTVKPTPAARTMVITIDDLPYTTIDAPYLANAGAATKQILEALKKHRAPVVGFVNEGLLEEHNERAARIALLKQWVDMGAILGNHTFSHRDFNQLTITQFEDEITKGEVVTRELMKSRGTYQLYFRHPMTHTGDTAEKKEAIEKFLAARGYKVTPHTIENSDFIFNVPYAQALHKQDASLARRVGDAYLDFTIAATEFAENISPRIFGHEIPQTLLIHANDLNADCLDELLARFESRGYRFVSLDEAMKDPAYQTTDTYVTKMGPTWLWRWMKSRGLNLSFAADPDPPQWVVDLYKQR
jgi:peptidoglycan/xylan/chitin deacetylase (PgdA/CDA1 family)